MSDFVFLYGTLMRGFEPHENLNLPERTEFAGEATCKGRLYDLGDYPGMTLEGTDEVKGELYRYHDDGIVDTLDRHEGYYPDSVGDSAYVRRLREMVDRDVKAWVYVYNGPTDDASPIESGSWREYLQTKE